MDNKNEQIYHLYGGEVVLRFNEKSHRYTISDSGEKFAHCPSVTTILNVLNKPALMEWAVTSACNYVEDELRTLLDTDSFSLEAVISVIGKARHAHTRLADTAADIGTDAHDWLARYWNSVRGLCPAPEMPAEGPVLQCVTAALDWIKEHDVKPILIEHPLYSRQYKITGTADFVGWVDGVMSIIDYKSTKAIWPEVALQMAPYASMYYEEFQVSTKNRIALRMDKITGKFETRRFHETTFDLDMDTFICAFKLYDRLKHLRRKEKKEKDWLEDLIG